VRTEATLLLLVIQRFPAHSLKVIGKLHTVFEVLDLELAYLAIAQHLRLCFLMLLLPSVVLYLHELP
jgi:hypothetical protein